MDDFKTTTTKDGDTSLKGLPTDTAGTLDSYETADIIGFGSTSTDSDFVALLKGIAGALVGALPGIILVILFSRFGAFASICGLAMATGAIYGYTLMTRSTLLDFKYGLIVCIAVTILGIYLAVRISWAWKFSELFPELYEQSYDIWQNTFTANGFSEEQADKYFHFFFDTPDKGFFTYFAKFGDYLEYPGLNVRFGLSLFWNYIFAAIGSTVAFKKMRKSYL